MIQERAEETLREAHERAAWLARFPEENPSPVLRASAEGNVLYRNPAAVKLPGWECEVGKAMPGSILPLVRQAAAEGREIQQDIELGGRFYFVSVEPLPGEPYANIYGRDSTERKRAEEEREKLIRELQDALANVKTLRGLLPICAYCKKIRDDKGYWNRLESYIRDHSGAEFTHGICPECLKKLYPDSVG